MSDRASRPLRIAIIAGEHSGDLLGGKLMTALQPRLGNVSWTGVGGETMEAAGLRSIFPMADVAVMGLGPILANLPRLVRRVYAAVDAVLADDPDLLIIVDSPEFTHPIAKRVRKARPDIPIVNYVSPTVWAWRSGRAKKMRPYVDHLLALLPFEPDAHRRLGGPPCSYVGHPMIERLGWIQSRDTTALRSRLGIPAEQKVLVVLPGSRRNEVTRLAPVFGETLAELRNQGHAPAVLVPTVASVRALVEEETAQWPGTVHLLEGEDDKFSAFRTADAALAASGTVTLELALSGTPMVVGYRTGPVTAQMRVLLATSSVVLANLVLGEVVFPEFLQEECTVSHLAPVVADLLQDTPARDRQLSALSNIAARMQLEGGQAPSDAAADIVMRMLAQSVLQLEVTSRQVLTEDTASKNLTP